MKKRLALLLSLLLPSSIALSCTHITLQSRDNTVMVGRTMEFGPNLNSQIISVPAGQTFSYPITNNKTDKSWQTKYGAVYINGFDINLATDGLNSEGLSISALYLPNYTEYAEPTEENMQRGLPYYQLGNWILGKYKSIEEVKSGLTSLIIYKKGLNIADKKNVVFPLHFIVTDSSGQSIVIEFIKGKTKIYDNPLGVLTNSPTFDWHLNNLKNYVNLSPHAPTSMMVDGFNYAALGEGAGMLGLPGDVTPPSRFVRMAFLTKTAKQPKAAQDTLLLAHHILANVYIPKGLVQASNSEQVADSTQWTVFKDLTHNVLYFKSYDYPTLQAIYLNKLPLKKGAPSYKLNIAHPVTTAIDVTEKMGG